MPKILKIEIKECNQDSAYFKYEAPGNSWCQHPNFGRQRICGGFATGIPDWCPLEDATQPADPTVRGVDKDGNLIREAP